MIIECINCHKKFMVESSLIPESGKKIQCGSCNHIWFYNVKTDVSSDQLITDSQSLTEEQTNIENNVILEKTQKKTNINSSTNNSNFSNILSYLIVGVISFIAIIIILDTFKSPLTKIFPNLELFLFNLMESLKDIFLFIKNLLQ